MSATKTKTFVSCAKPVKWRAVKTFFQLCTVANNTNQLFPRRVHCNNHSDGVLSLWARMYKWVDTKYIPAWQTNMYTNAYAHTQTHTHTLTQHQKIVRIFPSNLTCCFGHDISPKLHDYATHTAVRNLDVHVHLGVASRPRLLGRHCLCISLQDIGT